jgi:hypothetical protein
MQKLVYVFATLLKMAVSIAIVQSAYQANYYKIACDIDLIINQQAINGLLTLTACWCENKV